MRSAAKIPVAPLLKEDGASAFPHAPNYSRHQKLSTIKPTSRNSLMEITSIFEKLANTIYDQTKINELVDMLPQEIKYLYQRGNADQLRQQIAGVTYFPDARTVAQL
jgi:hypothetical protein